MKLKLCRLIEVALLGLVILIGFGGKELLGDYTVWAVMGALLLFGVVQSAFWRCPHCKAHLGEFGRIPERCPHCGKELNK